MLANPNRTNVKSAARCRGRLTMNWRRSVSIVAVMLGVVSTAAAADPPCELRETGVIVPSDGAASDNFGNAISMDGDRALIGAYEADDDRGGAYVFNFIGAEWVQEAKLTADDAQEDDRLGRHVALDGDCALVAAIGVDDYRGAVYVFRRTRDDWVQEAKLEASDGEAAGRFGSAVALLDDLAVVGAYRDDDVAEDAGAAYVFQRTGSTWTERQKLTASDGFASQRFGHTVALSDGVIIVGAPAGDPPGSAYVFVYDGSQWIELAKLHAPVPQDEDDFGRGLAIENDVLLVGAHQVVYVYRYDVDDDEWLLEDALEPWEGDTYWYGTELAISGDHAFVGGFGYRFDGEAWLDDVLLVESEGVYDLYGVPVGLSGTSALIGEDWADVFGYSSGRVLWYGDITDCEPYVGEYDVVKLGTLGGEYSYAQALNESGQVVGESKLADGHWHAFLWDDGAMTDLGALPGYSDSLALDINDAGQIVGYSATDKYGSDPRATLWQDGEIIDIGAISGTDSQAIDINENGEVLCWDNGGDFIYDEGTLYYLDLPKPGSAGAFNDDGVIAGSVWVGSGYECGTVDAYLWDHGSTTMLWEPSGDKHYIPAAVSEDQNVVGHLRWGWYMDCAGYEPSAWRWDATSGEGVMLPTPKENFWQHRAYAVNTRGDIVGYAYDEYYTGRAIATLWRGDEGLDLNDLIDDASPWELEGARDINDRGQIVGSGDLPEGGDRAFLLNPRAIVGDIDGDGDVDVVDLLTLLGAWGPCVDCAEDLNRDGTVDVLDLLLLLGNWT